MVDFCCGLGHGWSKGFAAEGFGCTGVDIVDVPNYPGKFVKADLFDWLPNEQYDVVTFSPECKHFSQVVMNWTGKCNPNRGLNLVWRGLYLINEVIKPKFWIMENVKGLASFIGPPQTSVRYGNTKNHKVAYLWGNFPDFGLLGPMERGTSRKTFKTSDPYLAEIPFALANAVAKAMKAGLQVAA